MSVIVITGANGEIGHSLVEYLAERGEKIVALDLKPMSEELSAKCEKVFIGDILDASILEELESYDIKGIYHLAALLSTTAEKFPDLAQKVNVEGTHKLLHIAQRVGKRRNVPVKFLFPSTLAVYGIPTLEQKMSAGAINEDQFLTPMTMYGVNKLYCEHLGRYFADRYKQLSPEKESGFIDFRAVRFPGLISAFTVPSGGTSDYGPEMIHCAAQNKHYNCFVRPDTQIPFMAMPDGVRALVELAHAPVQNLTRKVYNIGAFAPRAEEFYHLVQKAFPGASVSFEPDIRRQGIVDSWCADVIETAAHDDWGWKAEYDFEKTFFEYVVPNIKKRYS